MTPLFSTRHIQRDQAHVFLNRHENNPAFQQCVQNTYIPIIDQFQAFKKPFSSFFPLLALKPFCVFVKANQLILLIVLKMFQIVPTQFQGSIYYIHQLNFQEKEAQLYLIVCPCFGSFLQNMNDLQMLKNEYISNRPKNIVCRVS